MATSYERMVIASSNVAIGYNFMASISVWLLLAGLYLFPATFNSIDRYSLLDQTDYGRHAQQIILTRALLPISGFLSATGIIGFGLLWRKFNINYIWLLSHLFLPGIMHSINCFVTIIINVYTAQGGGWSPTAYIALVLVIIIMSFMTATFAVYKFLQKRLGKNLEETAQYSSPTWNR